MIVSCSKNAFIRIYFATTFGFYVSHTKRTMHVSRVMERKWVNYTYSGVLFCFLNRNVAFSFVVGRMEIKAGDLCL